jgi:hypothetical protein
MSRLQRRELKLPSEYAIMEPVLNLQRYLESSIDSGEQTHRALEFVAALDLDFLLRWKMRAYTMAN